jgi:hypothetical protein
MVTYSILTMRLLFVCLSVAFVGVACADEENLTDNLLPALHDLPLHQVVGRYSEGCRDMFLSCARWAELGVCESDRYTQGQKEAYCRRSCKLCKRNTGGGKPDTPNNGGGDNNPADDNKPNKTPLEIIVDALKDLKKQSDDAGSP